METRAQQIDLAARAEFVAPETLINETRQVIEQKVFEETGRFDHYVETDEEALTYIYESSAADLAAMRDMGIDFG